MISPKAAEITSKSLLQRHTRILVFSSLDFCILGSSRQQEVVEGKAEVLRLQAPLA
jgi:hypothetical protein